MSGQVTEPASSRDIARGRITDGRKSSRHRRTDLMHILLASSDLFKEVGGGQTFYRHLILRNPQVRFTYLRETEPVDFPRPENARAIACERRYEPLPETSSIVLEVPRWLYPGFARANEVAAAVSGEHFDAVDVPDYEQYGLFLRDAFDRHAVSADRVVLGMHGRISTSMELNWCVETRECLDLRRLEDMQYRAVDVRYFYSEMYRDEWKSVDPVPAPIVDPLWFFDVPTVRSYEERPGAPDLNFVGRSEKRKGPDIFVNLAWWLRPAIRAARLIGPANHDLDGTSSDAYLLSMIRNRALREVELDRCMTSAEMGQVYATKSITVIPSVYDTLNFVALESLLAGCPTAIGSGAGVCRYLREQFPGLPFEEIDVSNWYGAIPQLEAILRDYDGYRRDLREAILRQDLRPRGDRLIDVYQRPAAHDRELRVKVSDWYNRLSGCLPIRPRTSLRLAQCA
jgi:glycosyltransferase involved in cell wall biosynthesis